MRSIARIAAVAERDAQLHLVPGDVDGQRHEDERQNRRVERRDRYCMSSPP